MNDWWLRLLGVDAARLPDGAMTEFTWSHAPQSWGVFVLIALVLGLIWGVFYFYRREIDSAPRRWRMMLGAVRSLVIVLLTLVALGPALAVSTMRQIDPYVVVLMDESQSMSLADRYTDDEAAQRLATALAVDIAEVRREHPQRAAVVMQLLQRDNAALLRRLSQEGRLKLISFGRNVKLREATGVLALTDEPTADRPPDPPSPSPTDDEEPRGEPVPPLNPTEPSTDIAKAIREALRSVSGAPLAGIVLISDGQNTEGADPLAAADVARQQGVAVFTVGVGDPAEPRNLRIAEVYAPDSTFRDDPFLIQAQIRAEAMSGLSTKAELIERRVLEDGSSGPERTIGSQNLIFAADSGEQRITFEHRPTEAGDYVYTVRVPAQENELLDSDNLRSAPVKVLSDQARVLLISGGPNWEYRMVSQLLIRDKTTDVSCWLQSMDTDMRQEGNTVIDQLPRSPEELFNYDVIIMIDPDPREFDQIWIDALKDYLGEHGGGLLWVAGPQFTARFMTQFRTRTMRDVLPVVLDELSQMDVASLVATYTRGWPLKVTADGADHVMMRLDDDPQANRRYWEAMPPIYWSFEAREPKPASMVLAEHSDPRLRGSAGPRPLLVVGQYGPGRTAYMGFNGTWRWRRAGEKYFDQYWIQTLRYLVEGRLLGGKKRGRIGTDREVYTVGSRVTITAQLYNGSFDPMEDPVVGATVRGPGGEEEAIELKAVPNRPGHYEATIIATQLGLNEISVTLAEGGVVRVARQFTVEPPRIEFADPRLNKQLLSDIALRSGGSYFEVDQLHLLPEAIRGEPETIVIKGKSVELWDTDRLLILLVVLLTLEWGFRKRMRLM